MSATIDFCRKQKCGEDGLSKLVLLTLSFYCNWESGETWVSTDTLADECEVSSDTIRRRLQHLQGLGLIEIEPRPGRSSIIRLKGYREWHETLPVKGKTPSYQRGVATSKGLLPASTPLADSEGTPSYQRGELTYLTYNLTNNSNKGLDSDTTLGSEETRVWIENDQIKLCDSLNQFWLQQFDNQPGDLSLALMQIAAYVQPNSKFQNLEKQVSAQLSKIVLQRKERDRRYQAAAKTKTVNGKPVPQASKNDEILDKIYHDHWAKIERGEIKL